MSLEEKIRERAYELWEQAGRPSGMAGDFWEQAKRELQPSEDDEYEDLEAAEERRRQKREED